MSTDSESSPLFEFRDLRIDFGEGPLFQPLSASISVGERIHIQADSGAGKSSLLKSLMGFNHAAEGDVLFHGEYLSETGYSRIRSEVFYLPQNPNLFSATPRESWKEIGNFRRNRDGWPSIDDFSAMLKVFDLPPDVLETEFTTLSGGEKQRVLLALGAASGREIFFFDEALSGLDSRRRETVLDFYSAQTSWTLIIVSHEGSLLFSGSRTLTLEAP